MSKKRPLPPDRLAECAAAHKLFLLKKNELKLSQKKIADAAGISAPAVNLYFKGINPLNAQFAAVLSKALGEPVERFSPRLAAEIARIAQAAPGTPASAGQSAVAEPAQRAAALAALATPRSQEALERIAKAANEGRLTEADLILLEQIASRLESSGTKHQMPALGAPRAGGDEPNGNRRLREQLRNNDPGPRQ